jgi:shikimate dehydrogenase
MSYSPQTLINLIIGDPVEHSLSPKLQNYFYQKLHAADKYVFLASRVGKIFLPQAVAACNALGINGLAITIPHKISILKLLDKIDPIAEQIGAVNTVVNHHGVLIGYNTDYLGVLIPLLKIYQKLNYPVGEIQNFFADKQANFDWLDIRKLPIINPGLFLKGKKVAVIGAGGAGRGASYAVLKSGAELTIFNRTLDNAESLSAEFSQRFNTNVSFRSLENLNLLYDFDIIINTASNELTDNQILITKSDINSNQVIFDTIYKPEGTDLSRIALEEGAKVIYGQEMLFWQGVYQCKHHLGID